VPQAARARLYHTTALLLPDARVMVAGHDGALNMPPFDTSQYELELFSPPYLFGPDGAPAVRPAIGRAPASVLYGATFAVDTPAFDRIPRAAGTRASSRGAKSLTDQKGVGSSGRIRTYNPPVNSRMLYP
jgi:hypothetical protein